MDSQLLQNDSVLISMLPSFGAGISTTMLTRDGVVDTHFANGGTLIQPDIIGCLGSDKVNNGAKLIGDALYLTACHANAIANSDHSVNLDFGVARYRYETSIFHSSFE